jgi:uncharacterized protein (DUF2237 family)
MSQSQAQCCGFLFLLFVAVAAGSGVQNIMGGKLEDCSQPGTAMTGFTRDGRCADVGPADAGAHHVCIKMKSDFCTVTGQPNWCTTREFPCMGQRGVCKIGNWCVCQWAFSRYLQKAGGCDAASIDVKCDAINMATYEAYSKSNLHEHKVALECIKKRCSPVKDVEAAPNEEAGANMEKLEKFHILTDETECSGDKENGTCKAQKTEL